MHNPDNLTVKLLASIEDISADAWNALSNNTPLISHAFLLALEHSGCVGGQTGWSPSPLVVFDEQASLVGAVPLYIKTHSYGEYVFDWSWADAYAQHQLAYYPKLIAAIPFTPITSRRLLTINAKIAKHMINALDHIMHQNQLSSVHILFPDDESSQHLDQAGWHKRKGVQFRWENRQYTNFEDFLMSLNHEKRKKIRQDRKKVLSQDISCRWILGQDISEQDWDFFYTCYCNTYFEHHSSPYLTRAFFSQIGQTMKQHLLMIVAEKNHQAIAATLNFYNEDTLYGRYWGATEFVAGLHFELCYYQAQAFCIANQIRFFEGGAQGEHKLARGFEPRATCSYHLIAHPSFANAIGEFVKKEALNIASYANELEERAPFKKEI